MLKSFMIARQPSEVPLELAASAVILGNLDGLHLGHQQLLKTAQHFADPLNLPIYVFTFDPHPMQILPGKLDFKRIFPVPAQTQLLKQFGANGVYYQNFSAEFARTSAMDFLEQILLPLMKPKVIVVGFNFKFGQNRVGTPEFLKDWGLKNNVHIIVVDPFEVNAQPVSSSNIRRQITAGDVESARELLGFPFFVEGVVEKGAQRGRNLGFPTANVHWHSTLVPSFGVYVTRTHFKGQVYPSVSHLGPVPTFAEITPRLETHILDQDLALYGEELKVEFLARLRDPVKFDGLESLKMQIQKDIQSARDYWLRGGESMKHVKVFEHDGAGSEMRRAIWSELKIPVQWMTSVEAENDLVEILTGWDSEDYLLRLKNLPREVLLARHLDVIDHTGGKIWPRSLLSQAIRQIILRSSQGLDLRAWALVTGTSPLSRAALLSAFEVGYRMVRLVHADGEEVAAEKIRTDFEKFCFGLKIEPQKRAELTLQPNNGSLLINVEDLALDEDLLQTLLYLNFLHRPGLVLDFSSNRGSESVLLREARLSGFETVSGFKVRTEWDFIFLQSLKLAPSLKAEEYHTLARTLREPKAAE